MGQDKRSVDLPTAHITVEHTPNHVRLSFDTPHRVISSAVLNGGIVRADHVVNMKVPKVPENPDRPLSSPQVSLTEYCRRSGWSGTVVGMMTAASMDSLRIAKQREQEVDIVVLATSGLSNPRRAGDRAEHRFMGEGPQAAGTINIICLSSAALTPSAQVEAVMVATEAKAAALQTLGVRSPVSSKTATGTGTDAMAVVSGTGRPEIAYCGKHVLFGEILANLVIEAVASSVRFDIAAMDEMRRI